MKEIMTKQEYKPEEILIGHTPEVRELCEKLRQLIKEAVPKAVEKAYPGWHGIGYTHPEAGYFCAIFPQKDFVRLGFEFGILLPDPQGLLEGNAKQVRYLQIHKLKDIPLEAIRSLIEAAINLPSDRGIKLRLIEVKAQPIRNE
jgi:hypothetical protein